MKRYLKYLAPVISLIALFLLAGFRTIPAGKLWKGYNVLYVPVDAQESSVLANFNSLGIDEHYELSGQYIPLMFSTYSPEITMLRINSTDEAFSYLVKRNNFFFDKAHDYKLYYVPSKYKSELGDCVSSLNKQGIKAGIDGSASYPFVIPLICFAFALILFFFSKNRYVYGLSSVLFLVYIFCNPFYSSAVAFCLIVLCSFFISNIWLRKGAGSCLLTNYVIPAMFFFAFVGCFAAGFKAGFMFLIALTGAVSLVYFYYELDLYLSSKKSFIPVLIRPAKRVSLYAGKFNLVLGSAILSVLVLLGVSVLTSTTSINSKFAKLLLPAAKSGSSEIVNLSDYCDFAWNVSAFPYNSLNKDKNPLSFEYPRYEEIDGIIRETKVTKSFNDDFKSETIKQIDKLPFNSIEKVLKSQGNDCEFGFASSGSYRTGIFAIITMFVSLTILLFIYFSSIIKQRDRK